MYERQSDAARRSLHATDFRTNGLFLAKGTGEGARARICGERGWIET